MSSEKATDSQPTLTKRDDDPALVTGETSTGVSETALSGDLTLVKSEVPPTGVSEECSVAIQYLIRKLRQGNTFDAIVDEETAKDTAPKTANRDSTVIAEYTVDATPNPRNVKVTRWEEHQGRAPRYIQKSYEPNDDEWTYHERPKSDDSTTLIFYFHNEKEALGVNELAHEDKSVSVVSYIDPNGEMPTEIPSEIRELCQVMHPNCPVMSLKEFRGE